MFHNLFKKGLAVTLAATLFLSPTSSAYAAENFSLPVNPLTTEIPYKVTPFEVPSNVSVQSLNRQAMDANSVSTLADVQALADTKARTLTSVYGVTSIQYALIDNGVITVSGQAGSFSKDTAGAPSNRSMYGIASVSKVFTTTCVMNLVEEGKIELDKPVTTYIPEFTMADARYQNITVRMLLNHSSGLMGSTQGNELLFNDQDMSTTKNLLKNLKKQRLKANPGEFSVYCNDGFTLAEILVERVTGMSFSDYIKETITKQLGMEDTNTTADTFDENKLAKVYYNDYEKTLPTDNFNAIGTAGIYSTATDLCKFSSIFMRNSNSILTSTSLTAMENKEYLRGIWPEENDSTLGYGLGWDCVNTFPFNQYGIKALSKAGDSMLSHASFTVLPDHNMAIAVVSSGGSSAYDQIVGQEILLAALKAKGSITEIKPNKTFTVAGETPMPSEYKNYSGYYNTLGVPFRIEVTDTGNLNLYNTLTNSRKPAATYKYGGDGKFYYFTTGMCEYLSFQQETNGKTYLYSSGYSSLPGIGQTASSLYYAQKIDANPISKEVEAVWSERSQHAYFMVNEKYTSQLYVTGILAAQFPLLNGIKGYVTNAYIVDKNHAETRLEIPCMYGRDLADLRFYKKNKVEYLESSNHVYVSDAALKSLSGETKHTYLIGKDGYAKYYKITSKTAGKVMSVKIPKNAAFMVYKNDGSYVNNSYITGKKKVTLPKGGYVVFVGKSGSKFAVTCN